MQNTFGNESFLDEIAAATSVDPFEIRVRYLNDARGLELLERLRTSRASGSRAARVRAIPAPSRADAACRMRNTSWCEPTWASSPT